MLTYFEVESAYNFRVFEHDIRNFIWQDLATICPSAARVMVIYIRISCLLQPRDGQPTKNQSVTMPVRFEARTYCIWHTAYLSATSSSSYHCWSMPFCRRLSKPGVHIRRNRDHICFGLMFECPCDHWCWIEPESEGSSLWRIWVWAHATSKFSVPRSLCVTHGAPT